MDRRICVLSIFKILIAICSLEVQADYSNRIDNEIIGVPRVECSEGVVSFDVDTDKPFAGNVFIRGKSKNPDCSKRFRNHHLTHVSYGVELGKCGMQRLRSASPRGMNFVITFIVSFHPVFITKTDRAYHIRCFYREAEKAVTANLDISALPTSRLSDDMAMPSCEYTVRRGSSEGPVMTFANVGEQVYRRIWLQCYQECLAIALDPK